MVQHAKPPLTAQEIRSVARAACRVFSDQGFEVCLFGSAACNIYGMRGRTANDVDIIVLTKEWDTEFLKDMLIAGDDHFFKVDSIYPKATYTVLWYAIPYIGGDRNCKVDILIPGEMGIPDIPTNALHTMPPHYYLSLLPLMPLLLLKLIGWSVRLKSKKHYIRKKVPSDERDILELLDIAVAKPEIGRLSSEQWMPQSFKRKARIRVDRFLEKYPSTLPKWRALGFRVSSV